MVSVHGFQRHTVVGRDAEVAANAAIRPSSATPALNADQHDLIGRNYGINTLRRSGCKGPTACSQKLHGRAARS